MRRNKLKDWDKGTREDGTQEVEYEDEDDVDKSLFCIRETSRLIKRP